jgi:hypothetical protein
MKLRSLEEVSRFNQPAFMTCNSSRLGLIAILLVQLLSTGCLRRIINAKFPPLDTSAARLEAVRQGRKGLSELPRRDLAVSLALDKLTSTIPDLIKQAGDCPEFR